MTPENHNYIALIRAAYELYPRSFRYYEQLVEYVSAPIDSSRAIFPATKVFRILNSGQRQELTDNSIPQSYFAFIPCELRPLAPVPIIAVVEGLPSPEAISCLGSVFCVPPELFLGHLELGRRQVQPQRFYELPAMPSKRQEIIRIRTIIIAKNLVSSHAGDSMEQTRKTASADFERYERDILKESRYGSTRIRQANIHNERILTFEQLTSIHISSDVRSPSVWRAVILLDPGKNFTQGTNSKWLEYGSQGMPLGTVPTIPASSETYVVNSLGREHEKTNIRELHDFHPLKISQPTDAVELDLLYTDPFFLVSRILTAAVSSWNMLLNVITEDISHWTTTTATTDLDRGMQQLCFNAGIIDEVLDFVAEHAPILRAGGSPSWPSATEHSQVVRKSVLKTALLLDISSLENRCRSLARRCKAGTSLLVSNAQLTEAKKGIDQARQVQSLTKLAFIFVPAGFVSSMFGMNVAEFGGGPSIWIFFLAAVVCSSIAWAIITWGTIQTKARRLRLRSRGNISH